MELLPSRSEPRTELAEPRTELAEPRTERSAVSGSSHPLTPLRSVRGSDKRGEGAQLARIGVPHAIPPRSYRRSDLAAAAQVPRPPRLALRAVPARRTGVGLPPGDGVPLGEPARRHPRSARTRRTN